MHSKQDVSNTRRQTLRGRKLSLAGLGVIVINHLERFQYVATFVRKTIVDVDESLKLSWASLTGLMLRGEMTRMFRPGEDTARS